MNPLPATLAILLAFTSLAFGQDSAESFLSAFRTALAEKSPAKLEALTDFTGMTDAERALTTRIQHGMLGGQEIESVTLEPLPADFQPVIVQRGRKIEPSHPPSGLIVVKFRAASESGVMSTPYTIAGGRHLLIGSKITDLDWKGPPDKTIGYTITGKGQEHLRIAVKWNASGVTLEQPLAAPSRSFVGQHIEEITLSSENEDTEASLTVLEDGIPIYTSQPLKGKGRLEYKRP
jgi:hypothetical protein